MTVERLGTDATSSLPLGTRQRKSYKKKDSLTAQKRRKKPRSESLSTSNPPPYLQIVSVPIDQRVDPERNSYILLIQPVGIRAAGGQWSAEEAHEIARVTRGWDFSPGEDGDPQCLGKLEALLDRICKKGGEV